MKPILDLLHFLTTTLIPKSDAATIDLSAFTKQNPRCRRMVIRQRSAGVKLRAQGVVPKIGISKEVAHELRHYQFKRRLE